MAYDLAIGPSNDLIFSANRDLLGVSGYPLYEQRIKTRLKIKRGSWVFDTDHTLGSRLDLALGRTTEQAMSEITAFVHEALADMDDIAVAGVGITTDPNDTTGSTVIVRVGYVVALAGEEAPFSPPDEQLQEVQISFQL